MEYDTGGKSVKSRSLAEVLKPYLAVQSDGDGQQGLEEPYQGPTLPATEIRQILDHEMGDKTLTGALREIRNGV